MLHLKIKAIAKDVVELVEGLALQKALGSTLSTPEMGETVS